MEQLQYKYPIQLNNNLINVRISKNIAHHRYGWATTRHCNADYELHIILNGAVSIEVEGKYTVLNKGQGIIILPGQYHMPFDQSEGLEHFSIIFEFFGGELKDVIQKEIAGSKVFEISQNTLQDCIRIYNESNRKDAYTNKKVESLVTSIVISTLRSLELGLKAKAAFSPTELERNDIIDNFFDLQLKDCPKAKDLAKTLHISQRQLNRIIYKLYGMNFQQKLTREKMERAAWTLKTTNKKIGEIAEGVGYSSEAAFYDAFKKYFKTTPQKYRADKK